MRAGNRPEPCVNLNHRRRDAPVRHCSQCGGVVNEGIATIPCDELKHGKARRRQCAFCNDCGTRLMGSYH
jgi:hypothetical protein